MHMPAFTLACAGLLGLVFVALSARVVMGRTTGRVMLGHGETEGSPLFVAIRSHANFAEYVPICLILIAGLELRDGATLLVKALGVVLVVARVAHPVGMVMAAPNPFRAGGFVATLLVLLVAGVALVVRSF